MKRFRFKRLLATVLSFALLLTLTLPIASASEISANALTATITDNGDLLILQNDLEIRVTVNETSDKVVFTEYHNDEIFQEVTTYYSQPNTLYIQDFSNGISAPYTTDISGSSLSYPSIIPFSGKEYVGTMSGDAWHLHNSDKDFHFTVRVWNEITDTGTTSYTLPNKAMTAAQWAANFASAATLFIPGAGAAALVTKLIGVGTLIVSTGSLLVPSSSGISLSCNYAKNRMTMTPAANDPIYQGRTVTGDGAIYFIHDNKNPSHNGEIYHEGIGAGGISGLAELSQEIFYHLYNMYEPHNLKWDRA